MVMLLGMTTTMDTQPPLPDGPALPASPERLRRSRQDRVAAGVAGGLGRYFRVDPVLFRVLFAVLTLFGGTGIAIYAIGWLLIPEEEALNAPLDRAIAEIRRRRVPFVLAALAALGVMWLSLFSWWAPGEVNFAVVAAAVVIALLARSRRQPVPLQPSGPAQNPVSLHKHDALTAAPAGNQIRDWLTESSLRRRRSRPVWIGTVVLVIGAALGLGIGDAAHGIAFAVYPLVIGSILVTGLLLGIVIRRPPWTLVLPLLPIAGLLAVFGNSSASLHDGLGQRSWAPSAASLIEPTYRQGFGQSTLDLTQVDKIDAARTTRIRLGAGQVVVRIPKNLAVRVVGDIHFGAIQVDGKELANGTDVAQTVTAPAALSERDGAVLEVDVDLTAGDLSIVYV